MIVLDRDHLGLVDFRAERNAFGRQVQSFEADLDLGHGDEPLRAVFIRAPWIEDAGPTSRCSPRSTAIRCSPRQGRSSSRRSIRS